jgi:protein gp37
VITSALFDKVMKYIDVAALKKIKESDLKHGFQVMFIKDRNGRQGKVWPLSECASNCPHSPGCWHCPVVLLQIKMMLETGERDLKRVPAKFLDTNLLQPMDWDNEHFVFVCPQGDLFHPDITDDNIAQVSAVMIHRHDHTYLLLTKRAKRMVALYNSPEFMALVEEKGKGLFGSKFVMTNWGKHILAGVSVEDRARLWRARELTHMPNTVGRVLVLAPLLEDVPIPNEVLPFLDWVVLSRERGGSYCKPRRFEGDEDSIVKVRKQCLDASVPFFLEDRWTPRLVFKLLGFPREYPARMAG